MNGIRLEGKKESSLVSWAIKPVKRPARVRIPLQQFGGGGSRLLVQAGETVRAGQKIAEPVDPLGVFIHASLSGRVASVERALDPYGNDCEAVEVTPDDDQVLAPEVGKERGEWQSLGPEQAEVIFRDSGLVNLDEAMIPLHWQVRAMTERKIHTLVLNACEAEPYVTSDHSLMMSRPVEILKGAEILRLISGAEKIIIAIHDDKIEVAELLKSKIYFLKWNHCEVRILPVLYPQGLPVPLIHRLFRIDLASKIRDLKASAAGQDPRLLLHQSMYAEGIAYFEVATANAVYDAAGLQRPLIERVITVAGECVIEQHNYRVPLGLPLVDLFKAAKGLMREPGRVILGGPMQGMEQPHLEVPVMASSRAALALPKEVTGTGEAWSCIHSGQCVEACPVDISPVMITLAAENELFLDARDWGLEACIDCGNCTYVCPSKRPMASLIRDAREGLRRLQEP